MKLSVILFSVAACLSSTYAADLSPGKVKAVDTPASATPEPTTPGPTTPGPTTAGPTPGPNSPTSTTPSPTRKPSSNSAVNTSGNKSTLDDLKPKTTYGSEYHMPPVRVVHARVDADKPVWSKDRFISVHGQGDQAKGYRAILDTVNTASVEGALMYVQAEGINVNSRSAQDRCLRKNNMTYVIFMEIMIAQTNETIAKYSENNMWNVPEYSQMQPMDHGQCRKQGDAFPPECLQFNGDDKQPDIGPSVGGGLKNNDVRAPYPETYWFSFPNTCPLSTWNDKEDPSQCRQKTRKGLCDIGQMPDGVDCTFAYDILGWVPLDDVVGITSFTDSSGKPHDFWSWCKASTKNIEFAGDDRNGEATESLDFWKDPKNPDKNAERANKVITLYQDIVLGKYTSPMISESDRKHFKDLPNPSALAEKNPPCYKSVPSCNNGNGCERLGFSQICTPCKAASKTCKVDKAYTMPKLEKAKTTLSDAETTSVPDAGYGANGRTDGTQKTTGPAASGASSSVVHVALSAAAVVVAAAFTI